MMNENKVKEEAKRIMDAFMAELGETEVKEDFGLVREENIRDAKVKSPESGFKARMLKNAPKVKDDMIVAEKKTW